MKKKIRKWKEKTTLSTANSTMHWKSYKESNMPYFLMEMPTDLEKTDRTRIQKMGARKSENSRQIRQEKLNNDQF